LSVVIQVLIAEQKVAYCFYKSTEVFGIMILFRQEQTSILDFSICMYAIWLLY